MQIRDYPIPIQAALIQRIALAFSEMEDQGARCSDETVLIDLLGGLVKEVLRRKEVR